MVKQTIMRHPESHSIAPVRRLALVLLAAAAWFSACSFEPTTVGLCMTDAHCSGGQMCNLAENVCVPLCRQHSECTAPGMPICDTVCRQCESATECMIKDPLLTVCTPDGACTEPGPCVDSRECSAETPMCNGTECVVCSPDATGDAACTMREDDGPICTQAGTCGECRNDSHCTTDPAKLFCDFDTGACRGCQANSECESNVCDKRSGQCAAPADVLYVDGTDGMDSATCGDSGGAPCKTITAALARVAPDTHRSVRIEQGIYAEPLSLSDIEVTLVGEEATIQPAPGQDNTAVIAVGSNARVKLQGLQVRRAYGDSNADGIRCASADSSVEFLNVIVTDNDDRGLDFNLCSLTMERSTVSVNRGGGILVFNAGFSITNSFIVDNGNAAVSPIGGVRIENTNDYTPQVFSFNTVARNQALSAADASGVRCFTNTFIIASNNIIYGGVGEAAPVSGPCVWAYSNVEGGAPGTGNIDSDPMFKNIANGNFHITPGSPCENAADPAATISIDFDGDPRPYGDAPDMGADELVPAPMQ